MTIYPIQFDIMSNRSMLSQKDKQVEISPCSLQKK